VSNGKNTAIEKTSVRGDLVVGLDVASHPGGSRPGRAVDPGHIVARGKQREHLKK